MPRRYGIFVCIVGALLLIYGLWNLNVNLFQFRAERIVALQSVIVISSMEGQATNVYVHPNKDTGFSDRGDVAILVEYTNVRGNLTIDHYYVNYGSMPYDVGQRLDSRRVTGNGSITFEIPPTYVGVHKILARTDYKPSPTIYVQIYTIHYEPRPDNAQIMSYLTASLIGTLVIPVGITLTILKNRPSIHQ